MALAVLLAGVTSALAQESNIAKSGERRTHAKAGAASDANSISDAERAARLAEGRRKFFEQSQGFDHESPPPATAVAPSRADLWPNSVGPRLRR